MPILNVISATRFIDCLQWASLLGLPPRPPRGWAYICDANRFHTLVSVDRYRLWWVSDDGTTAHWRNVTVDVTRL